MDCLLKLVDKPIDKLWDLGSRHVGYIFNYEGNFSELKDLVDDLEREEKTVKHQVDDAINNGKGINENVEGWLTKADKKITEAILFQNDEGHAKTGCSRALLCCLCYRHRLGRKAKKMAVDVKSLIDKSKFEGGVSHPQTPTCVPSDAGYEEFVSRRHTMKNIMAKLKDPTVRMIGVYGPGGVGKTTLVKAIAKKAQASKLFNVVVPVVITDNPNPLKIQEDIAYVLGLRFEGEGEIGRADRLRMRLKTQKENTLVILDDLWDGLDLNKLGIPLDDYDDDLSQVNAKGGKVSQVNAKGGKVSQVNAKDGKDFMSKKEESPSGDYKRCKILLTSRSREVLCDKMNVEQDSVIAVTKLHDDEAVKLFKKEAGIQDGNSKFKPEIVKYFEGLPVAIVTAARALRALGEKNELVWEDALEKLKKQELIGVQKSMEFSVKMSYDHLESEELKSIFLLCARMGHQPLTMDLVKYCFGLGILKGVHTLRDARDRISTSINKLKDSSLVSLDGNSSDHFSMHDMVREAALSIAHNEQNVFTLRNDKLDDWPDKDELERCTAISIHNTDIVHELPKLINCPQLKVFQFDTDDPSLKIPKSFFEGMEKLRVLILTGFHLQCLPNSIKCLSNLRMLCLERCVLRGNLSSIGELKKLKILSFSGSEIKNLPAELGCLSKLQLLDLSDCSIGNVISPHFISSLTGLEELYMRKSLIEKEVEDETNQSLSTILAGMSHLHRLTFLDICIPSAAVLPSNLFFNKLNDYKIVVGDLRILSIGDFKMPSKYEASRSLALELKDGTDIHSQKGIKMLFKRVENLLLGELKGVQNAFDELNLDGFPYLKRLSIINNSDIEYIINSMELPHPHGAFPNLESLSLYKLSNIKMICCSPFTGASFKKLKTIKVNLCTQLKNLFSFSMVKFLTSVETIDVSECDSLEEIVIQERQVNTEIVGFHKLRSLTLEALPSFTCFYTNGKMFSVPMLSEGQATNRDHTEITIADDEHSVAASVSLFGELVEIPNLASLKLSSIDKIHKIWSDQPLSSSRFQNLIKLTVKDCHNLRYLCSLAVASYLKKLKGLFISECRQMKEIIEGNSADHSQVCIFPNLEEIQLINMNMLTHICEAEVDADSFSSLVSVHIDGCRKIEKIFPSHMVGRFGSLDSLKVVGCDSVKMIFELEDSPQTDAFGIDTRLRLLYLSGLPNLKRVWNRDPAGILSFKSLRSIKVGWCHKLSNILPASVAKDLEKLEEFSVQWCHEMEEIVAWEEGSETSNKPLVFPEVTHMELRGLPNIKRFYMGGHLVDCPKLKRLEVSDCDKLEAFTTEATTEEGKPVFSAEKVISNLEHMEIGLKEANWLRSNLGKYRMHRLKELRLDELQSIEILYWFLHRIPSLERLELNSLHDKIKELVPSGNDAPQERLGTVLQLKELSVFSSHITDIGFEKDPVLQTLERLVLRCCHKLIKLAPSPVSFTHLTYLAVQGCPGLEILMASSTAKSLVQLTMMKVIGCKLAKEIVSNEGNEEDGVVDIEFSKLITLELVELDNLTSFCSYKNCKFNFPSLEKLIVRDCPKMKTFTESQTLRAPKLQNILADEGQKEENWHWGGDLNATIQKAFTDKASVPYPRYLYTRYLNLSDYFPDFEKVWYGPGNDLLQEGSFRNLKTLIVAYCENIVHVIPSHLLPCFKNLETLDVSSCSAVQVIFNINDITVTKDLGIFRLKKLSLSWLRGLEHVWDKDPEGILCFKALQHIDVRHCDRLKNLFPASMAKDLAGLEELSVSQCNQLVEIFEKDEIAAEGATKELVFHFLTTLKLTGLPELKYFYPGLLECPVLEFLHVYKCDLAVLKCLEAHPDEPVHIQIEEFIRRVPSLEELSISKGDTTVTCNRVSRKLKFEKLEHFQQDSDSVLDEFLQIVPSIEELEVGGSSFTEMFCAERPKADYILSNLKRLKLNYLMKLNSIGLEHCWLLPILQNLQTLKVTRCRSLPYLFTSSTAKSLVQLKRMKISRCESMQEIVCKDGDESHQGEKIIFGQLQSLHLEDLENLICFYPGNFTLCFPSLEEVTVIHCPLMKTFCAISIINPNKLSSGFRFSNDEYATPQWQWEGDLNTTLRKTFAEKIGELTRDLRHYSIKYEPASYEIWRGLVLLPDISFSNLKWLVADGVEFLTEVLPSRLISFFTRLESLTVRNCVCVKNIFDVKCIKDTGPAAILPFSLKELILHDLPNLENVWNGDPDGVLRVQHMQQVSVDTCKCLPSLFPASVAKDLVELENLNVKHCEGLVAIVAEDEGSRQDEIIFGKLQKLNLETLPNLRSYYNGSCTISFPSLEQLSVIYCSQMETFCQGTINANNLSAVKFNSRTAIPFQVDLNSTIQTVFQSKGHIDELSESEVSSHMVIEDEDLSKSGPLIESKFDPQEFIRQVPSLKVLSISKGDMTVTCNRVSQKLEFKKVEHFQQELDSVLDGFLQIVPSIKELEVGESSLTGMFSAERPNADYIFSNLEGLKLYSLEQLNSIGLEYCWLLPILENLQTLEVARCDSLPYLFTSSTVKSLVRLKRMTIRGCKSMQEIMCKDGDASHQGEKIIFGQLRSLHLEDLENLRCFYPGNFTLCFPSLEEVTVIKCHSMKTFYAMSIINPNKLSSGFRFSNDEDAASEWQWAVDLNTTMPKAFEETIGELTRDLEDYSIEDKPVLYEMWHGLVLHFRNLKSLIADGVEFLTEVLPSHLLSLFTRLERLKVRNCVFVKNIFDVKCIKENTGPAAIRPLPFSLKELILEDLPSLVNVWNEDPDGVLRVQHLQQVYVNKCVCLPSLFPASIAKDLVKLKNLNVKHCEGLMAIVAEDGGSRQDEIIFRKLRKLNLEKLSNLRSFYNGSCTISFPSLEKLSVIYCHQMENFCPGTINANKLSAVQFDLFNAIRLQVDLNSTIQKVSKSKGNIGELSKSEAIERVFWVTQPSEVGSDSDSEEVTQVMKDTELSKVENVSEFNSKQAIEDELSGSGSDSQKVIKDKELSKFEDESEFNSKEDKILENLPQDQENDTSSSVPSIISTHLDDAIGRIFRVEHPDPVHGFGHGVCPPHTSYMPTQRNIIGASRSNVSQLSIQDLQKEVETLQEKLTKYDEIKAQLLQTQTQLSDIYKILEDRFGSEFFLNNNAPSC